MLAKVYSAAVVGLEAQPIEVEVDLSSGLHSFQIVGLPDTAVNEAKERVSAAIKNIGARPPHHTNRRVIVNLAPADLKKEGPAYDLPIALSFLIASGQIKNQNFEDKIFVGELSLEGKLRPVNGILPIALMAKEKGFRAFFVPKKNAFEASLVKNLNVIPVENLTELIEHLNHLREIPPQPPLNFNYFSQNKKPEIDLAYIKGQNQAKRALEITAAGGHNLLMTGPPGAGKTLLARALSSILPPLSEKESLEVTKIFSVAGLIKSDQPLITQPPFRQPHHTASAIALVGGGTYPKPGEITLAHRGVLFLDEFPEFSKSVLESLRQPLEDGIVTISRASGSLTFPAKFTLVAAMNPCPCGYLNDPYHPCRCSASQINRYKRKISGPLLDRIDLYVQVPAVKCEQLTSEAVGPSSLSIQEKVIQAREIQRKRFQNEKIATNSEMNLSQIKKYCLLDSKSQDLLKSAVRQYHLSARSYYRTIKIARTIADLSNQEKIKSDHLMEALQYRPHQDIFEE